MQTSKGEISRAVSDIHARIMRGDQRVVVTGPPAAGKSSVLSRLRTLPGAERLIRVDPPVHAMDAAPVALTCIAASLDGIEPGLVAYLRTKGPWREKSATVLKVLGSVASKTVVLLDEPLAGSQASPIATPFGDRLAGLATDLFAVDQLRIVMTAADWQLKNEVVAMRGQSNPQEILQPERWGQLAESALRLSKTSQPELEALSPLELRLRVALVEAGVATDEALRRRSIRASVELLFSRIAEDGHKLRKVVASLSVFRVPFQHPTVARFGANELDPRSRALLESALLLESAEGLRLHDAIAAEARRWLTTDSARQAHAVAVTVHREMFEEAAKKSDVFTSVRQEMEVLHHRTQLGDATLLLEDSIWFSDQYVELGYTLSIDKRLADAVRAYERAVDHEPTSAYAHHYLAWNLDVQGQQAGRVESHYRAAIEHKPDHAWYQGRLVRFLITRGRIAEARTALDAALAALLEVNDRGDRRLYDEFHAEIVRLLLHRGQLEFARDVLADVPESIADRAAWFQAESRLLEALLEARDDLLVIPPRLSAGEKWTPQLFAAEQLSEAERWMAGRIDSIDDGTIHIRVGWRDEGSANYAWLHLPEPTALAAMEAPKLLPAAGTFVELLTFKDGTRILRQYPGAPFADEALPGLFPPPDRYIRLASPGN